MTQISPIKVFALSVLNRSKSMHSVCGKEDSDMANINTNLSLRLADMQLYRLIHRAAQFYCVFIRQKIDNSSY